MTRHTEFLLKKIAFTVKWKWIKFWFVGMSPQAGAAHLGPRNLFLHGEDLYLMKIFKKLRTFLKDELPTTVCHASVLWHLNLLMKLKFYLWLFICSAMLPQVCVCMIFLKVSETCIFFFNLPKFLIKYHAHSWHFYRPMFKEVFLNEILLEDRFCKTVKIKDQMMSNL